MSTQNGQNAYQAVILMHISDDTRHVSKIEELLTPNQIYFLDKIRGHGKDALIESLRSAHDSIAYVSDLKVDKRLRNVLFDLKLLGDWLESV